MAIVSSDGAVRPACGAPTELRIAATLRLGAWLAARRSRALIIAGVTLAVLSQAQVVHTISRIYPYEYMYLSPVVGQYSGAHADYETDYWGVCSREAAIWLGEHYRDYTASPNPTYHNWAAPSQLAGPYLPKTFRIRREAPDFAFWTIQEFLNDGHPDYPAIHDVKVDGVTLCQVKVRPDLATRS